jgi:hypothetical protein
MMSATAPFPAERRIACARCGTAFVCGSGGSNGRCWCADETARLPVPALRADDCLCLSCLQAALRTGGAA